MAKKYDYTEGPLSLGNKKCTDLFFLLVFVLFKIVSLIIFYEAYKHGAVQRLLRPTDYQGNVCGSNGTSMADKPLAYYPRLAEDMRAATSSGTEGNCVEDPDTGELGDCRVHLYTICVARCPAPGEIVCRYGEISKDNTIVSADKATEGIKTLAIRREKCWVTPMTQQVKFNRCIPAMDEVETIKTYQCCYSDTVTSHWPQNGSRWTECPRGCCTTSKAGMQGCTGRVQIHESTDWNTTAGVTQLQANLVRTEATIERWFGDCVTVMPYILLLGIVFSVAAAAGYCFIMQYIAGCLVWIVVLVIFVIWVAITAISLFKGGSVFGIDIPQDKIMDYASSHANEKHADQLERYGGMEESEKRQQAWMYIGHGSLAFTLLYASFICAMTERIQLTIELIKVTAKAIQGAPTTLFIPILEWLVSFLMLFYFLVAAALIVTTDWDPTADLKDALQTTNADDSSFCPPSICPPTKANVTTVEGGHQDATDNVQLFRLAYQLFGWFWSRKLLEALTSMVVAGAVAEVFWTKAKAAKRYPTKDSLVYIFRYHFGSACFGSFILALIEFTRSTLAYVQARTKEAQKSNPQLKALLCVCQLCLTCFERCVQ
jgi:hypothetical protein